MGSRTCSPSHEVAVDQADSRLESAKQFGAHIAVNNGREDPSPVTMLDADRFVTHHFDLSEMEQAYNVFANTVETGARKVFMSR